MRFMLLAGLSGYLQVYPGGFDEAGPDFAPPPEVAPVMKFNEEPQ